jgi:phosphatidylinositol alpha-1,6-mannosyltransferase
MPDLRYVVVGAGPDLGRLKAQVTDSSLEGNVVFAGKVSQRELSAYYALCDIFIMPSRPSDRFEGFGLVYAEAGAYGKPVIAGRTGGVPEVVQDGHNGILVDPMDVDGLERAIRSLLSNPGLARSMGCNGRRQVMERFNILRMAESTLQVVCEREGRPKHGGGPGA